MLARPMLYHWSHSGSLYICNFWWDFFFLWYWGFELRASCLPGRCALPLVPLCQPYFVFSIFQVESQTICWLWTSVLLICFLSIYEPPAPGGTGVGI
jgi:hypothetical protein